MDFKRMVRERMIKRVARVAVLMLTCIPIASFALGLGPITMRSALNQPLLAEIDIHHAQPGDLDGLAVRLAARDDFKRVNVERISFLDKLHFSIAKHADGSPYIKITTTTAVTEPYLDFLIEARWARGRALKEYTVLVDPPVLTAETPAPVQQASTAPVFSQPAPQPAVQERKPIPRREPPARQAPPQPKRAAAPAPRRVPMPTRVAQSSDGSRYTVKTNDTLSGIAQRIRPDSVSLNQMMLALLKANPRAFYNNNINRLKAGYVLRTKGVAGSAASMSREAANREVHQQNLAWREGTTGRLVHQSDMAEASSAARNAEESSSGNEVVSKADETARLKLVAPGKDGAGSGSTGKDSAKVKKLQQDLILATEALDANKAETDELKTRLADLDDQLTSMQRLINLKDEEMQRLQNSLKEQQDNPQAAAQNKPEAPAANGEKKKPVPAKPAKEEQSFIASLLSSDYTMLGVAVVLVLAVVAWLVVRRRKMQEGFQESILNVGMGGDTIGAAASSQMMMQPNSESSMVSDFSMSGMDSMQQDSADVDPISEADVYLAYGRHQQAEDIIRQALERSPDRLELRSKLIEVLAAAKNRAGFEEEAQNLHQQLGGDETNELWTKVVALGSQLAPDNPMFGGSGEDFTIHQDLSGDVGDVTAEEEDLLDFDFDENDAFGNSAKAASDDDDDLDFDVSALDFDLDEEEDTTQTAIASVDSMDETNDDDNVLDFDLGGEDELDITQASVMERAPEEEQLLSLDDDDHLDLSLEPETTEASDDDNTLIVGGGSELSLEGDDEFSLDTSSDSDDILDLDLHLDDDDDTPVSSGFGAADNVVTLDTGSDDDEGLGDDIFADVDEIGTKLDLAKAYVDMGDSDGARSILDEVLEEGDDTQKQQAEQLLQQMG